MAWKMDKCENAKCIRIRMPMPFAIANREKMRRIFRLLLIAVSPC